MSGLIIVPRTVVAILAPLGQLPFERRGPPTLAADWLRTGANHHGTSPSRFRL